MRRTFVIPAFSHVEVRKAEIQGRPHPMDVHRAHYASALTEELVRRFKASGDVDYALADRIEAVLWPNWQRSMKGFPWPARKKPKFPNDQFAAGWNACIEWIEHLRGKAAVQGRNAPLLQESGGEYPTNSQFQQGGSE